MAGVIVKPRARILHGHDWVMPFEILKVYGQPEDGDVIAIKDGRDHLLGSGIYNARAKIPVRRFSKQRAVLNREFFSRRIDAAKRVREMRGVNPRLGRIVWSESDGLPGVIVDRYLDCVVLQTLTLAMDREKQVIAECLRDALGVECVVERNDASGRIKEGLEEKVGMLIGEEPGLIDCEIAGVQYAIDVMRGQKTGFYLDQITNYSNVAAFAAGKRVLDCFTNQGGFALSCAAAGAQEVVAVDTSGEAVDRLRANAERNGLRVEAVQHDVFYYLRQLHRQEERFDLIILDPPSFARGRGGKDGAMRGYRDLHQQAAKLLSAGGMLATYSCSHHVTAADFEQTVREGFWDGKRIPRLVRRFMQPLDHPILLTIPETEYLKGLMVEARMVMS